MIFKVGPTCEACQNIKYKKNDWAFFKVYSCQRNRQYNKNKYCKTFQLAYGGDILFHNKNF